MIRINELNELADKMVSDGEMPEVFFVRLETDTQMVTTNFQVAYNFWQAIARDNPLKNSSLESRGHMVICSVEEHPNLTDKKMMWDESKKYLRTEWAKKAMKMKRA